MNKFHRVVFGGGDMFQGGGVNYRINTLKGSFEAGTVTDIADEVAQGWILLIAEFLSHFVLFELVPAKNNKPLNFWEPLKNFGHESVPKAASSAGDQN
jgi:hypothetical protein